MSDTETRTETPTTEQRTARRRNGLLKPRYFFIAAIVIASVVFGGMEVQRRLTHVHEEDARIRGEVVTVSARSDGWLTELLVEEGDQIREGDVIARVDDRAARLRVEALQARVAGVAAERSRLLSQRRLTESQTTGRVLTRESATAAVTARRSSLMTELDLARSDLRRMEELFERNVVPRSRLDTQRSLVRRLENQVREAEAEIAEARSETAVAVAGQSEVEVIDQEIARLDYEEAELRAELEQQILDVRDRQVRAPIGGIVDRIFVERGEYVSPGRRLLMMHDPGNVWIEANIRETSVRKLHAGQAVTIRVDAYPGEPFTGRVTRIGSATTAQFALLPTPNPSGNFTKITQRIPVRIDIDATERPLRPGMMVVVDIDVRDRDS